MMGAPAGTMTDPIVEPAAAGIEGQIGAATAEGEGADSQR
jgi:hypothetical protein